MPLIAGTIISPSIMTEIARVLRLDFDWDDEPLIARLKLLAKVAEVLRPGLIIDAVN
jgi:hypothetical protein